MYQTKVHKELINFFTKNSSSNQFFSMSDIQAHLLKLDLNPNKTTLYRQLSILENNNQIYSNQIQGKQVWGNFEHTNHNHFVCSNCHVIKCLNLPKTIIESIQNSSINLFQISSIKLEGICNNCKI